jgi:RimJ/RimL family protein N-acetyltransferase
MEPVELTDGVVTLSAPTLEDVEPIVEACQDPDVAVWTTVPSPYTREDAVAFVSEWVTEGWSQDRQWTWVIRRDGALAGMAGLSPRPPGSAEVGYWLAPAARGQGLLHRALHLVLAWGFDPAGGGLEQVEWHCLAGNWPSWRAAWRVGFQFEGVVRLGAVQRGVRRDDWVGTLLRGDAREPRAPWPATTVPAPQPPTTAGMDTPSVASPVPGRMDA